MTNDRAVEIMKAVIFMLKTDDYSDEVEEAIHMAINALETHEKRTETHTCDCISRKAAIDLFPDDDLECDTKGGYIAPHLARQMICELPFTQQNARIFQGIIVEYPSISTYPEYEGKPYFSIKYTENGQGFIGYGTYKPDVLSEYLKKYFMSSAQPEIIQCKECKYWFDIDDGRQKHRMCADTYGDWFCADAERRTDESD